MRSLLVGEVVSVGRDEEYDATAVTLLVSEETARRLAPLLYRKVALDVRMAEVPTPTAEEQGR